MNNLYEQLMYIYERGFYSVVYATTFNEYLIFSNKSANGLLRFSGLFKTIDECKKHIGATWYEGNLDESWQIVDTIHPSELMGKGFQVGDKVSLHGKVYDVERMFWPTAFLKDAENEQAHIIAEDCRRLKPVLPVEENNAYKVNRTYLPLHAEVMPEEAASLSEPQKESSSIPLGKLPHYCKHGVQISNGYACNFCKKEEKKECEHKVGDVSTNIGFETNFGRIPLFLCKCGLVTCVDPSRSSPSKNPNQE